MDVLGSALEEPWPRRLLLHGGKRTMIYAKHSGFVRISLALVALVLATWSMTSMIYAGQMGPGCPAPCDDTLVYAYFECWHTVGPCNLDHCVINSYRVLKCTECPIPGKSAEGCIYHTDSGDWYRFSTLRIHNCDDLGFNYSVFGDGICKITDDGKTGRQTPCSTSDCYGTWAAEAPKNGRALCGGP